MSSPQHEPTMEEILASIRKIISEDVSEGAMPGSDAPAATPGPEATPQPEPDVLELTQEFVEGPALVMPVPMPEPHNDIVFQAGEPAHNEAPMPTSHDGIFSNQTRQTMDNVFANIAEECAVRESFESVLQKYLSDNSSAVIEHMKPLIREWMDEHFPALLEGAVRAEIERVAKARGARR